MAGDDEAISELLRVQPGELRFIFRPNKQLTCILRFTNSAKSPVAFKVKTTSPRKYCVRPNTGVLQPRSSLEITVIMQAQQELSDPQCKDKFLVQSVLAPDGFNAGDISQEMFLKDSGNQIHEIKLKVSLVTSEKEEPGNEYVDDGTELGALKAKIQEVNAALTTVSEERNAAIALSQRLQQEMSVLTSNRRTETRQTGFSFFVVFLVGLLGILLGFLLSS